MNVVAGGVFCAGAFDNSMQSDSPALTSTALSQWSHLDADPLGRDFMVLKSTITQGAYVAAPSDSAKRAEVQSRSVKVLWGQNYTYHWRIIIPTDWINYGATSYAIVAQMHDVNAPGIGRRPSAAFEIIDNILSLNLSRTAIPTGFSGWSIPIRAGDEIELTVHARWADGTNEADGNGVFRAYHNGSLCYSISGRNTWDNGAPSEPNPPFLKAGIYQPNTGDAWWVGKRLTCYHVAAFVAGGFETPESCRAYVDGLLKSRSAVFPAKT